MKPQACLRRNLGTRFQDIQSKAAEAVAGERQTQGICGDMGRSVNDRSPGTFIDELIRIAGGENISGDGQVWNGLSLVWRSFLERDLR